MIWTYLDSIHLMLHPYKLQKGPMIYFSRASLIDSKPPGCQAVYFINNNQDTQFQVSTILLNFPLVYSAFTMVGSLSSDYYKVVKHELAKDNTWFLSRHKEQNGLVEWIAGQMNQGKKKKKTIALALFTHLSLIERLTIEFSLF